MGSFEATIPRNVEPVLRYRDGYSPRVLLLPDGAKIFQYLHNKYWAVLDHLETEYPGYEQDIIQWAWEHAGQFADGHPYDYVYELFGWTLPFEISLNRAMMGAATHNAANDYLEGIYECFETFINDYKWPTPLTYRRLLNTNDLGYPMEA